MLFVIIGNDYKRKQRIFLFSKSKFKVMKYKIYLTWEDLNKNKKQKQKQETLISSYACRL